MKRSTLVLGIVAVALALGLKTPSAEAHAVLLRSQPEAGAVLPQPPVESFLFFSEELEMSFSKGRIVDAAGKQYDNGDFHVHSNLTNPGITLQADMPNGTYTFIFDVLSAVDGHRTKGAVAFFVGPPGSAPAPGTSTVDADVGSSPPRGLEVVARWFNFAAMAALIGAALFPFLVLRRGFSALPDGPDGSPGRDRAEERAARAARLSVLAASAVLLIASVLSLWLQVWAAGGSATSIDPLEKVISDTRFGDIWIYRIALVALALVCAYVLFRQRGLPWAKSIWEASNSAWLLVAGLAIAIPGTTSLNSHAAASGSGVLATLADWIHLVAGGIWVGGLVQLGIVVLAVVPKIEERSAFFGGLIRRFSLVAVISVSVIVATGVFQSIERLGGIGELVDTAYGSTLLIKLLLLTPLLGIAAFNLLLVGPRFVSLARGGSARVLSRLWENRFRLAVSSELGLAVGILIITAVLTSTSPPGPAAGITENGTQIVPPGSQAVSAEVDDLKIQMWANPARVGMNEINVILADQDGDEREVQLVNLRINYLEEPLGAADVEAEPFHPPIHYIANTPQFSLPGKWEVEVIVRREGLLDARAKLELTIGA